MQKRAHFEGEREVRIIHWQDPPMTEFGYDGGPVPDVTQHAAPGVNWPVDVSTFIEEVYLSPFAPTWHRDALDAVLERFEFRRPSTCSRIDLTPPRSTGV